MAFTLTTTEIVSLVVVVILSIIIIGFLLFTLRRLRERRTKILGELSDRPQLIQDRAFNRIAMARREAEILGGQGNDVHRSRDLIAEAQGAFDTRNFDRAYELAQQAHEALVHTHRDGPGSPPSTSPNSSHPAAPVRTSPLPSPASAATASPSAASPPIAKNRAESQFQLRLLDQELEEAHSKPVPASSLASADQLRTEAHGAFDRGDFTAAFRLALKARRAIGGHVESLPLTPGATAAVGDGNRPALDATLAAEQTAAGDRCPKCGYPARVGDAYCRGCGEPRTPTVCPQCGASRQPADTFCGRCGTAYR
jgi:hypothetical protein